VNTLTASQIRSLLVVGAHAFDAEVIAGPLIGAVVGAGGRATMMHLSLGEQGHTTLTPAQYAEQKRAEAAASAAALGSRWETLALPDGFVPVDDEIALRLCDLIREVKPDVIVTHWSGSWHKDHRAAHTLTVNAAFFAALPTLTRAAPAHSAATILFGENWEDGAGFRVECVIDVSDGMRPWRTAVQQYELARGLAAFPYYDYYSSLYRLHGCTSGCQHAQAFAVQSSQSMAGFRQFLDRTDSTAPGQAG
jgi:N-acetylglucosamine malate deacetylase 1